MKNKIENLIKYVLCGACVILFFSCQKKLTQFQASKELTKPKAEVKSDTLIQGLSSTGESISIDTLKSSLHNGTSLLSIKDSYYNQKIQQKILNFYEANSRKTKWLNNNAPNDLCYALLDHFKNATRYGLRPEDYDINRIEERLTSIYKSQSSPIASTEIVDLDIHITEMFFLFTTHLIEGKIRTAGYGNAIWIRQQKTGSDLDVTLLSDVRTSEQLATAFTMLQPQNEQYVKLQKALEEYRTLEKSAAIRTVPAIPAKEKIKPEARHAVIPFVRSRLTLTDKKVYAPMVDTTTCMEDSLYYDNALACGIKLFQAKNGLEPDGIIGERTLRFLNQSFKEKADLIALNMERLKWIPESYGNNYILVNVPEFKLRVFENEEEKLRMNVIVGAPNKPTPIFNDVLEHIVFSPTWTVPNSIIKEEIIPRLKKDPDYYTQKNYSFYKNETAIDPASESWDDESINPYQYRVVQQPGPDNSLGLVKFVLKNSMSVYMHDTPNHNLFSRSYRALSHGCVRLDEPALFAEYLLRDQKGWGKERIQKSMYGSNTATIQLKKRYPVYIEYRTVWVDENNELNFREDIYGHDRRQLQQLFPAEKGTSTVAGLSQNTTESHVY